MDVILTRDFSEAKLNSRFVSDRRCRLLFSARSYPDTKPYSIIFAHWHWALKSRHIRDNTHYRVAALSLETSRRLRERPIMVDADRCGTAAPSDARLFFR